MEEEEGCSWYNLICHGKNLLTSGVESIAESAFHAVTSAFAAAAEWALHTLSSFWMKPEFVDLSGNADVAWMHTSLAPYVTVAVVVSVLIAAGQIMWTQRGAPLKELGKSLATVVVVSGVGVLSVAVLMEAANEFSIFLVHSTGETGFTTAGEVGFTSLVGISALSSPIVGLGTVFFCAIIAFFVGVVQIMLLFVRSAMLLLLASVLPLATAATNTAWGKEWAKKIIGWTAAFILFKPVVAIIIALGATLIADEGQVDLQDAINAEIARLGCDASSVDCQQSAMSNVMGQAIADGGDGGLSRFLMGIVILAISLFALPALLRFTVPAMSALGAGAGAGVGAMIGGASSALATGAIRAKLGGAGALARGAGSTVASSSSGGSAAGGGQASGAGPSGGSGSVGQSPGGTGPGGSNSAGGNTSPGGTGSSRGGTTGGGSAPSGAGAPSNQGGSENESSSFGSPSAQGAIATTSATGSGPDSNTGGRSSPGGSGTGRHSAATTASGSGSATGGMQLSPGVGRTPGLSPSETSARSAQAVGQGSQTGARMSSEAPLASGSHESIPKDSHE